MMIMAWYSDKMERVCVSFAARTPAGQSMDNSVWLPPEQARSLLVQLQKAVDDIPAPARVACAADLGVAA